MDGIAIIILILTLAQTGQALIGFDCGISDPVINTYSLLNAGECEFNDDDTKTSKATIELLQTTDIQTTHVIQCKIEITRTIFHYGMFSHLEPTANAIQEYMYNISEEQCKLIHTTGIFKYDNMHTITNIKVNSTKAVGVDIVGKVKDKSYSGASNTDDYGSLSNVFVQGLIKITLLEQYVAVNQDEDEIRFNSDTVCKFSDLYCIDMDAGHSFWTLFPTTDKCFNTHYNILYKGPVTKIENPNTETIYTINSLDIAFSISIRDKIEHCNRMLTRIEHSKLFIYETTRKTSYSTKT